MDHRTAATDDDAPETAPAPPDRLRVAVVQPALPRYRVPVFRELNARPGIDLRVYHENAPHITSVAPDGFPARTVPARRLPGGLHLSPAQYSRRVLDDADVVVLSWNVRYLSLLPAILRARRRGVGVVLWGHGYSKSESALRRRLRNAFGRCADALLLYNTAARDELVAAGFDNRRVFVALNSIDQAPIAQARRRILADPETLIRFQSTHRLDPTKTVLFVSRLSEDNGVDLLLRAAATIRDDIPGLRVVIVGDGDRKPELETLAQRLGVSDLATFTGAVYGEEELAPWFCSARVFCYPKNIGLSLLHAFGYGLPVVTSDRLDAQNPEIEALRDGENGVLYPDGDADALARTLAQLLTDDERAERLGANALRTVQERFSIAGMVDGFVAAIRAAADRARS